MSNFNKKLLDYYLTEGHKGQTFGEGALEKPEFQMAIAYFRANGYKLVNYRVAPKTSNHSVYYFTKNTSLIDGYHRRIVNN